MNMDKKTLLVVGAGGFIGGFIAAEGLRRGYDTYVGIRATTSRRYLGDARLKPVVLDYDDPDRLEETLREAAPSAGRWDYIIWNLGATKCADYADFNLINFMYPRTFVEILRSNDMVPDRFLYMSSLSAIGPGDEKGYTPIGAATVPNPNTRYGLSKIKTETYLETLPDFPWIIFRPTGVYGPHEKDYLMMIKSIDSHWDFAVGFRRQLLTFIYVDDLVGAMFDAIASDKTVRRKYIISEERAYTQKEFRNMVARELGRRFVIPVRLPMWAVYAASALAEKIAAARSEASTLNRDKFRIMKQRNWSCDVSDAVRDFGFSTRFPLERGIRETVAAYRNSLAEEKQARKDRKGERR